MDRQTVGVPQPQDSASLVAAVLANPHAVEALRANQGAAYAT